VFYSWTCTVFLTQNYCYVFPSILVIVPRFPSLLPSSSNYSTPPFLSLSSSFQLQSCCTNYFKVIRALIAGRCFSGGQVPGGQAPSLTQFLPSALFPPPHPPHRLSLPGARLSFCHASTQLNHCRCCPAVLQEMLSHLTLIIGLLPHRSLRHASVQMAGRLLALRMKEMKN